MTVIGAWVGACGGGSGGRAAAVEPSETERLWKQQPASPMVLRSERGYRATERCGQGPYRIELPALSARYAESVEVAACGPHLVRGNLRLTRHQSDYTSTSENSFGGSDGAHHNEACVAAPAAATATTGDSAGGAGGDAGKTGRPAAARPAAARQIADATPVALTEVETIDAACTTSTGMIDMTYTGEGPPPLPDGSRFAIEIWSDQPMDLDGIVFIVRQRSVKDGMTAEGWTGYQEAYRAWSERYRRAVDRGVATGRITLVNTDTTSPVPPAPRAEMPPPRPSTNATWIGGYWHRENDTWSWIEGFWRVPESDIKQELTVKAPEPPPVEVRPETPPERPAAAAVWTAGYWQWDGTAYVWIDGAWRIPPRRDQRWRPARWKRKRGAAVFVPGGWTIRIGR